MEIILRAAAIYMALLVMFRLLGKRSLSQLSAFDLIVFLIISEAVQNALVDDEKSVVVGLTIALTFVMLDLGLSLLKRRFPGFETLAEGLPVGLVERGRPIEAHMRKTRITQEDILEAARLSQGLERMAQIRYAVLETNGSISIIPSHDGGE